MTTTTPRAGEQGRPRQKAGRAGPRRRASPGHAASARLGGRSSLPGGRRTDPFVQVRKEICPMTAVRVLVGTRKGAFVLTSDGKRDKWDVAGPFFAGWEIYHVKGSPVDPNRLYASQSSGWFGQQIQRSSDGGKTWEPVGNKFVYDGGPTTHQW